MIPTMRARHLLTAIGASGVVAAACSTFGSDTDTTTADADASTTDASASVPDGASSCPTKFTESFSDPATLGVNGPWSWDKPQTYVPGDAGVADGALVATVDAPDGGVAEAAFVRSILINPGTLREAVLRFKMMFHQDDAPYGNFGCELRLEDDNAAVYTASLLTLSRFPPGKLALDAKPFGLDAGDPPAVNLSTFNYQTDTWFPVTLRIHVDSPDRGTLSIDEPASATIPSVVIPPNTTALRVHCGLHYVEGPGRTTVALDDVSLDVCGP